MSLEQIAEHAIDHAALGLANKYTGLTVDTKATILAASPARRTLAYATDTDRFYVWDGSAWMEAAIVFTARTSTPNMGYEQDESSQGYGTDYISDKVLAFCKIGAGADDEEGAVRCTTSGVFQVYLNGVWNDVVINFVMREDSSGAYELEHAPIGFDWYYEVMSGNSDKLGIDGKPIVQGYTSSMGCMQHDLQIDGGSF